MLAYNNQEFRSANFFTFLAMKIIELFNVFREFPEEDYIKFQKFLNSPYMTDSKVLFKLFEVIHINKDLLKNSEFDKLVKKISRKLKYSPATTNKRISALGTAALNYFKIKSLLYDIENSELSLNRYLLKNKYFSLLKNNLDKTEHLIFDTKYLSDNIFWLSFNYNSIQCDFITVCTRFSNYKNAESRFIYLNEASVDLALYNLIQQINLFVNYIFLNIDSGNHKKINFPVNLHTMISEYDKNNIFKEPIRRKRIYELYKSMFLAFHYRKDTAKFIKYKQCFNKIINFLNKESKKYHNNILTSYCAMKERLGENIDFYRKEEAELLLNYIEKGYFKTDEIKHLHSIEYRNFILIAFSLGDYKLLKYFINNCTSKLNKKDHYDMLNLGLAFYYYGIKNYNEALKSIKNIEINNFIYRFDIRNILLRIYFETGEINKLLDSIHNYKKIISDDKTLDKSIKDSLRKMLKYLNKLIIIKKNPDLNIPYEAGFLMEIIQKEPVFALKKWFLETLEEYSNSPRKKTLSK